MRLNLSYRIADEGGTLGEATGARPRNGQKGTVGKLGSHSLRLPLGFPLTPFTIPGRLLSGEAPRGCSGCKTKARMSSAEAAPTKISKPETWNGA